VRWAGEGTRGLRGGRGVIAAGVLAPLAAALPAVSCPLPAIALGLGLGK